MKSLRSRLLLSHLLVAVLGALATVIVVLVLTPLIFDRRMGSMGAGMGGGAGPGNRQQLITDVTIAVTQALGVGLVVGVLTAAAAGIIVSARVTKPLRAMSAATRRIAAGDYDARVERPDDAELAALADDVNTLGGELAETERRRTRLLGEVAHEMRTPLTIIDGYVEGMIDGILTPEPEQLGKVSDEVRRLRRLSDDLSALSRAEEGRLALVRETVDVRMLVDGVVERLRAQAEDAGIRLTAALPAQPCAADVDGDRIGQVVTNLIGNAIRATPPGGQIDVAVSASADGVSIRVIDSGEGLTDSDLERIFERFYRVPGRRGGSAGSGIGLTIARGIVRAHGGELTAASDGPGRGAVFTVALPRGRENEPGQTARS